MNAQAINFNNIFKTAETQKNASADFDLSDDRFSKTFDEIKAKYENEEKNIKSAPKTTQPLVQKNTEAQADTKTINNLRETDSQVDSAKELKQNDKNAPTTDSEQSQNAQSENTNAIDSNDKKINNENQQETEKIFAEDENSTNIPDQNTENSAENEENTETNSKLDTDEPDSTEIKADVNTDSEILNTINIETTEASNTETNSKLDTDEPDSTEIKADVNTDSEILNTINIETTEASNTTTNTEENTQQITQKTQNNTDSAENKTQETPNRINNLKKSSTTTVEKIISTTDDSQTTKTADSVILKEIEDGVQIKASEKVEQATKDGTISQTKELSSQAKQTALENLQSIQGTDTTVVEAKSANQADTGANNGSSFSQGNAAEQIIKMSVENADTSTTTVSGTFQVQTDKAVNSTSSTLRTFDLNKADIMNQIGTKMQQLTENGQSKVTIILKPENLGRIQLEILNTGDGITARMLTENQQVKELLDKNMETLKSQLGAQGVNVNNIKVENTQQTTQNFLGFEQEQFSREFFGNSHEHHAANTNSTKGYEENKNEIVEDGGEAEPEVEKSQILHNGNVDYKV